MKSILTRLTEAIGDSIANNYTTNEFVTEKLKIDKNTGGFRISNFSSKELEKILREKNPELHKELVDYINSSKDFAKLGKDRIKRDQRNNSSNSSSHSSGGCISTSKHNSGVGCGSSRSSGGCGSSSSSSYGSSSCGSPRSSSHRSLSGC